MTIEWKKKKHFDGETCGVRGCSRKAAGYLTSTRPGSSPNGHLWFGPICAKCHGGAPLSLKYIAEQRDGVADVALVLNIDQEDAAARMQGAGLGAYLAPRAERQAVALAPAPAPTLPTLDDEQKEAEGFLELLEQFHILSPENLAFAEKSVTEAVSRYKELEEERKRLNKPHAEATKRTNALFSPLQGVLKAIEAKLKERIAEAVQRAQQAQEQALQASSTAAQAGDHVAAAQAGDHVAAAQAMQAAQDAELHLSATRASDDFEYTITNPLEVPRQYLVVDEKKIRAAIKAGTREIPGVEIRKKVNVAMAPGAKK